MKAFNINREATKITYWLTFLWLAFFWLLPPMGDIALIAAVGGLLIYVELPKPKSENPNSW